jgi:hypothetical protein
MTTADVSIETTYQQALDKLAAMDSKLDKIAEWAEKLEKGHTHDDRPV